MTRRGFSLVELLVAILVIATLVGAMTGFVWDVLRTRDALAVETARERAAGVLLDVLERDLQTVVATGPDGGSGVRGEVDGLRIAVASTPVRLATPGRGTQALGTVDWLDVRFDAATRRIRMERIAARRGGGGGGGGAAAAADAGAAGADGVADASADDEADLDPFVEVDPFGDAAFDEPVGAGGGEGSMPGPAAGGGGAFDPAALEARVFLVEFRYHDGTGWRESFDSGEGGLPVAVEVSIWFEPWPGAADEDPFSGLGGFGGAPAGPELGAADDAFADLDPGAEDGGPDPSAAVRPLPDRRRIVPVPDARAGEVAEALESAGDGLEPSP